MLMNSSSLRNVPEVSPVAVPPFLKWAGGKRWLSDRIVEIATQYTGKYVEPFLGGGAVFFCLKPKSALLSDVNEDLITTYQALRSDYQRVELLLKKHQKAHTKEYFYQIRAYRPRCPYRKAARFLYLNRTCWNGLYRVNRQGQFNVPIGTKSSVLLPTDNWKVVAELLEAVEIVCGDFEHSIDQAGEGDFVFADPPYTVKHNLNGFIKYNDSLFSWNDQIRLRNAVLRAKDRGAIVVVTNANHASVRELYQEGFDLEPVVRASVLAGSPQHRGHFEELLIT